MTEPSTLKKLSELAHAAEILFQYNLISVAEGHRIAQGIFDGRVDAEYKPMFQFFPIDGTLNWQTQGWLEDGLEPGLEANGKDAIEFIKSKPAYGSSTYLKDTSTWCVCTPAGPQSVSKPRQVEADVPVKRKPGRPPKNPPAPVEEPPKDNEDIPY